MGSRVRLTFLHVLLVASLMLGACSDDGPPSSTPAVTPVESASGSAVETPTDAAAVRLLDEQVVDLVVSGADRTLVESAAFVFDSTTVFGGGTVQVVVDGTADPTAEALRFDTQITAPDADGQSQSSLRSYVYVDGGAWYLDDDGTSWTTIPTAVDELPGSVAQGIFVEVDPPGRPPLLPLLTEAASPAVELGPGVIGDLDVTLYRVTLPLGLADRALGPTSSASFRENGVDIAALEGELLAEVGVDVDGFVRWVELNLTPVFVAAAAAGDSVADPDLDVLMRVSIDLQGDSLPIEAPVVPTPTPVPPAARVLAVGECYVDDIAAESSEPVACTEPHRYEVFEVVTWPGDADAGYPGNRTLGGESLVACREAFADRFGVDVATTTVEVAVAYPSLESWVSGDRQVGCSALTPTASVESLDQIDLRRSFGVVTSFGLVVGDCLLAAVDAAAPGLPVVSCDQPHTFEVFFQEDLTADDFPGEDEINRSVRARCEEAFEAFVGEPENLSPHELTFFAPSESTWDDIGDRTISCLVEVDEPVTGTLEGSGAPPEVGADG